MGEKEQITIALCDQSPAIHDQILQFLKEYETQNNVTCELSHMYTTFELLSAQMPFDMLLLEIDMPNMDGLKAALRLREQGVDCKIVMLTSRVDRFKDAFKIGAVRFVTKPVEKREMFEAIDSVRMCVEGRGMVQVFLNGRSYCMMQREITYIMADGSETKIFTQNYVYRSEHTLSGWKEQLDEGLFFLCHRSYIVNLAKIANIEKTEVVLKTGEKVPVARRKEKELLQRYMKKYGK